MPSKLKKAIGAVKDQTSISLAKVSNTNASNLEVAVLKATTHDDVPIDERYVNEVLKLVSSDKVYAAACARALGKRIGRTRNWIVALKSLMLVLRLFQDGDPYFPREVLHTMKRGAKILNLTNFRDDSNSCSPWDYTAFVRTFALYLDERLDCFLTGKLQRRYKHKERESLSHRSSRRANEPVREMKPPMLLDRISYWQRLLERAIATRPTGAAKANRLVQISLYAVLQESFDLYRDISDGLTLLLDSFFHLQYHSCVSAFQICVKASKQYEELTAFYTQCKSIGIGRTSEYPSVQIISEELIETLQEFLKDQSSFPGNVRSPSRPLLLPAPASSVSGRHNSYGGQSEFSEVSTSRYSEGVSEFGSQCTSLEELISATGNRRSPSISIDLEAYSDQFEKRSQRDDTFRVSDTGSTRSLPVSSSMVDLVSLGDWPEQDEEQEQEREKDQKQEQEKMQSNSAKNWEVVLAETATPSTQPLPTVPQQEQKVQNTDLADGSRDGWELVLAETATQIPTVSNTLDAYNQSTLPPHHYNPFLQEPTEVTATPTVGGSADTSAGFEAVFPAADGLPSAPTFHAAPTFSAQNSDGAKMQLQAAPTFCAQSSDGAKMQLQTNDDPFGTFSSALGGGEVSRGSTAQQNLLYEQQLWLQQQNKIIAKHMA
ncbi:hypothetical protein RJ640_013680 [Escallonia rubra]|uniref:ENTH domain-containing protein n=1 Tax=Escallonia rubra TaxID=112253 RepID=A0AA88RHC1_9ASTE|nr:hypothetical protein RJ640_013680 [Escallonia rubra]